MKTELWAAWKTLKFVLIHKQERGLIPCSSVLFTRGKQIWDLSPSYQAPQCDTKAGTVSSSRALIYDLSVELLRAWHGKSSKWFKKTQQLWHLLPPLKEPVVGGGGAFTSLCFLILWAFPRIWISEQTGAQSISQLTKQMNAYWEQPSLCPQCLPILIWGLHKHILESLFQNCVISNWSCPKNSETLRQRGRMELFLCVVQPCAEGNKACCKYPILAENGWHWLSCGCWIFQFLN